MKRIAKTETQQKDRYHISDSSIFDNESYASCIKLYMNYFHALPNEINLTNIISNKAISWVEENFKLSIAKSFRKFRSFKKTIKLDNVIYILNNGIILDIEEGRSVCILYDDVVVQEANEIAQNILKFKMKFSKLHMFHTIVQRNNTLALLGVGNKKPRLEMSLNYNSDLCELHKDLLAKLKQKNNCGLILFHGVPGTGKTTYIRYLMHFINKTIIFLSPKLAANLDSPELARILIENENAVLVIEDAEELLKARESGNFFSISTILNLADGMLGESLGTQIICTFNTHKNNIDKALLRKGRLLASYEFKPLTVEKTNLLLENLGHKNYQSQTEMTLAEIYNIEENGFVLNAVKKIGFGAVA